jgi:hypothetical protein
LSDLANPGIGMIIIVFTMWRKNDSRIARKGASSTAIPKNGIVYPTPLGLPLIVFAYPGCAARPWALICNTFGVKKIAPAVFFLLTPVS